MSPGEGGPGGLADSDMIDVTHAAAGATGPSGETCPYTPGSEEAIAHCTLGTGEHGADGPDRGIAKIVSQFSDFENKRFRLVAAWYEFHWWRLFELVANTSIPLMVSDDSSNKDPLASLISGEFEEARVATTSEKWLRTFVQPLQSEKKHTESLDPEAD